MSETGQAMEGVGTFDEDGRYTPALPKRLPGEPPSQPMTPPPPIEGLAPTRLG